MAKKKKQAGKLRLPKKVGGYKIPKSLRKSDILVQLSQSPGIREICAAGIAAAAAALAGNKHARPAAGDPASKGSSQLTELVSAIGSVAVALLGKGEPAREAQNSPIDGHPPAATAGGGQDTPVRGKGPH